MLRARRFGRNRYSLAVVGALVISAGLVALGSAPAEAARQITPPQGFACGTYYPATISISPPRVWASANRPEQVLWGIQIQRWNGTRWYAYGPQYLFWSTFNYYGQSPTSWSVYNTSSGGWYTNSKLHLPVKHVGYYRLAVSISSNGGGNWAGFVGDGAHCYMN